MPNLYRSIFSQDEEYENREEKNLPKNNKKNTKKKNKKDFKTIKKNTIKSLNDVEYFLNNFGQFIKYAKIYNYIKKKK